MEYKNTKKEPFVSVLLVTRNERSCLEQALNSLLNQTYPKEKYEIIIVDGLSEDGTADRVCELINEYGKKGYDIRLLYNKKRILASGWNLGILNAKGDYVVRIDAHAKAEKDFIEKSVKTILTVEDSVCVGGKLITRSMEDDCDVVSKILSSPFGVGNSSFRISNTPGYTDTAVYGLYKKKIFEQVGYFDEFYVRNQDIEIHSRIKKAGGKFYFNPEIKCVYYTRNTVKKMAKQAFENGKWNMVLLKNGRNALSLRHLIPFGFVMYLIVSSVMGLWKKWIWKIEGYVILLHIIMGVRAALEKTKKMTEIIVMPILFLILHLSYGVGYIAEIFIKRET